MICCVNMRCILRKKGCAGSKGGTHVKETTRLVRVFSDVSSIYRHFTLDQSDLHVFHYFQFVPKILCVCVCVCVCVCLFLDEMYGFSFKMRFQFIHNVIRT